MNMSLHSLEVVNRLTTAVELPPGASVSASAPSGNNCVNLCHHVDICVFRIRPCVYIQLYSLLRKHQGQVSTNAFRAPHVRVSTIFDPEQDYRRPGLFTAALSRLTSTINVGNMTSMALTGFVRRGASLLY